MSEPIWNKFLTERDRRDDLVAVEIGDDGLVIFVAARVLPQPGAGVPIVVAAHAGSV